MKTGLTYIWQALAGHFNAWRNRQRAYTELAGLDDRSLADIGITRSDIPYILAHSQAGSTTPGEKVHGLKHAA